MERIAEKISKHSKLILLLAVVLLIPSVFGYLKTDINYDILSYLPENVPSTKAEKVLENQFGCGALSMLVVENMEDKDVAKIKDKIAKVDGVDQVLWVDNFMDLSVPKEMLPKDMTDLLYSGDKSTMMIIKMEEGTAALRTLNAVESIKDIAGKQAFLSGMCGILKDTKDLADKELPFYVIAAGILILIILQLTLESTVLPFILLLNIGMAVIYNFGSNIIFGEISYITKALAAVLQLGVTMDYSIFLLHRYQEEKAIYPGDSIKAMTKTIRNTVTSVIGGSQTTIAGFLALCVMQLGFGKDIGLVMAKGVLIGVLSTITVLPSFILIFDKQIDKYKHRTILPKFKMTSKFVIKHYKKLTILFIIIFIPAFFGYKNAKVYYNLDESLPASFPSIIATNKMKNDYNMESTNFILIKDTTPSKDVNKMIKEIENLEGINSVLGLEKYIGPRIDEDFLPDELLSQLKGGGYEQIIVNSKYKAASDKCNSQIEDINKIVHKYDKDGLVGGEGPLTLDLIKVSATDLDRVSIISIIAVFIIIAIIFKSFAIPVILVFTIQCAIYVNLGIPYYTGTVEPFIASIVLGTIQLGATIDYAILLVSRYKEERNRQSDKFKAMEDSIKSSGSAIITSALSFFGATIGVGFLSKLEMISVLCSLMARGAIISMIMIIFILPALLLTCDKFILKTSKKFITTTKTVKENN
ncbi:MAG: MMPL family transporter [Terrisporobacter sp.]|uniref:efflux RND transporter permease subunit n=1 Tax=Terrisporobacter sp. TaxID=1965305 RepID=UPI002FC8D889